jgi:hypothetical protein
LVADYPVVSKRQKNEEEKTAERWPAKGLKIFHENLISRFHWYA